MCHRSKFCQTGLLLFWSWAEQTPIHDLTEFCNQVHKELLSKGGNGYIATYNPLLSYLTGSHNNLSLLGSHDQAKSAIFYLCPYLCKNKFPLLQSMVMLNKAVNHIKQFPSRASDTDTHPQKWTAKYIIT